MSVYQVIAIIEETYGSNQITYHPEQVLLTTVNFDEVEKLISEIGIYGWMDDHGNSCNYSFGEYLYLKVFDLTNGKEMCLNGEW